MKKGKKIIGKIILGALAVGLTPYHIGVHTKTGAFELESLLWSLEKIPGEERDKYVFELLPLVGGKETPEKEPAGQDA